MEEHTANMGFLKVFLFRNVMYAIIFLNKDTKSVIFHFMANER